MWLTFERFDDPSTRFSLIVYEDHECSVSVMKIGAPLDSLLCAAELGPSRHGMVSEARFEALDALFSDELLKVYRGDASTSEASGCAAPEKYHLGLSHGPARNLHSPWFSETESENSAETTTMLNELNELMRSCHAGGDPWREEDAEKERSGDWPTP